MCYEEKKILDIFDYNPYTCTDLSKVETVMKTEIIESQVLLFYNSKI